MVTGGFFGALPDAWAIAAEHLPRPWPEECVVTDLRWWADRVRMGAAPRLPTVRELSDRWGWSRNRASTARADVATWADPAHLDATMALVADALGRAPAWQRAAGQDRDRTGTGPGQTRDSAARSNADYQPVSGQAQDRTRTGPGQRQDTTRAVPYSQYTIHNPQGQHAAGAAPARPTIRTDDLPEDPGQPQAAPATAATGGRARQAALALPGAPPAASEAATARPRRSRRDDPRARLVTDAWTRAWRDVHGDDLRYPWDLGPRGQDHARAVRVAEIAGLTRADTDAGPVESAARIYLIDHARRATFDAKSGSAPTFSVFTHMAADLVLRASRAARAPPAEAPPADAPLTPAQQTMLDQLRAATAAATLHPDPESYQ